jgi:hypothetical protein
VKAQKPVEAVIALSIVFVASEVLHGRLQDGELLPQGQILQKQLLT